MRRGRRKLLTDDRRRRDRVELVAKGAEDDAGGGEGGDDNLPRLEAQKATLVIGVGRSVFVGRLDQLAPQPALVFVSLTHPRKP